MTTTPAWLPDVHFEKVEPDSVRITTAERTWVETRRQLEIALDSLQIERTFYSDQLAFVRLIGIYRSALAFLGKRETT